MATTLTDQTTRDDYTATASQTEFPYTFWINKATDLDVYVNGSLQTITTDYTVDTVQDDDGGTVTFTSGLTEDDAVAIVYNPEIERLTDFTTSGSFTADAVNLEYAYIVSLLQYLDTELSRTLSISASDTSGANLSLPSATANTVLGWNSSANALQNYTFANITSDIDTDITGLTNGDILQYNSSSGLWENAAAPSASIADASLTVAKLANGTDGELITWDASGVAATVSAGTSGQVLTSNGAGAAPTFQTSPSAPVTSVNTKTGAVVLTAADVGLGNVANVDQQNASNLTSGTVGTARLGSGTADATTYLRGDQTWQTISSTPPTTYGAVGTYIFAAAIGGGAIASGGTIAGSNLRPAAVADGTAGDNTSADIHFGGSALSGTWRLMGDAVNASSASAGKASLWVRTA
jgi:hypothetical protein